MLPSMDDHDAVLFILGDVEAVLRLDLAREVS